MPDTVADIQTIVSPVTLAGEFLIGSFYDTIGRKVPVVLSLIMGGAAEITIAFSKTVNVYLIASLLEVALIVTHNCPFVPDLIEERSQGVVNTLRTINLRFGAMVADSLLGLNSYNAQIFSPFNIYVGIGVFSILVSFVTACGLKDVIKLP